MTLSSFSLVAMAILKTLGHANNFTRKHCAFTCCYITFYSLGKGAKIGIFKDLVLNRTDPSPPPWYIWDF